MAKEQEQQTRMKSQSPLAAQTGSTTQKQQSAPKQTTQVKDLTSSLMNSNLSGLQSSSKTAPNYQPMGGSSMTQGYGMGQSSMSSNYSAMSSSGVQPNYSSGSMMGNMQTGSSFGGQGYGSGNQYGSQGSSTKQMDLSAFDNLMPSSSQPKSSLNQMQTRQTNPSSMGQSSMMSGGGMGGFSGGPSNFNAPQNYGQYQPVGNPMQSGMMGYGQGMGNSAMFGGQPMNSQNSMGLQPINSQNSMRLQPMNSQNSMGLQPMGAQQYNQQHTKKLGQNDLADFLG